MKPHEFYLAMQLPEDCSLGRRVFKKHFYDNATLSAVDKRALSNDVQTITLRYALTPQNVPIQPYTDETCEYQEIAILEVFLKEPRNATRVAGVVQHAIPYPVILVLACNDGLALSVAHKRFSRSTHGEIVAEGLQRTPWLKGEERTGEEIGFLNSLSMHKLPQTNFQAFYNALYSRILAIICTEVSGRFTLPDELTDAARLERLDTCRKFQRELVQLKKTIRKETSFARQVDLNVMIKKIEQELEKAVALL